MGGGHSHVTVLKQFAMRPMAGVRLTLVTSCVHTPYRWAGPQAGSCPLAQRLCCETCTCTRRSAAVQPCCVGARCRNRWGLVTPGLVTCSGMLPGYISGFYSFDDVHIDLSRLARFAGARLIHAEARGLDTQVGWVLGRGGSWGQRGMPRWLLACTGHGCARGGTA